MGSGTPLERALYTARKILLAHAVIGITKSPTVQPNVEAFWRFALDPILADRSLMRPFAEALATVYDEATRAGHFPGARLYPLINRMESLVDAVNARAVTARGRQVVLFDDGVLLGSVLHKKLLFMRGHGASPVGVYSVVAHRRSPPKESTVGEVANFFRVPRVLVCDKEDLVRRLVAFDVHKEWLPSTDARYAFALTSSFRYKSLRDGGDIAAYVPPTKYG